MRRTPLALLLVVVCALLAAGCGTQLLAAKTSTTPQALVGRAQSAQVAVIRSWAQALQRGNVNAAADLFALPSLFANGPGGPGPLGGQVIRSHRDAVAVNESLTCGASLVSTIRHGHYVIATFRLTNRHGPGADCGSGVGQEAATAFLIRAGHIVDWIRAPLLAQAPPGQLTPPSKTSTGPTQPI